MAAPNTLLLRDIPLWQEVVTNFEIGLSSTVINQCRSIATLNDLDRSIAVIEREQAARRSYRNLAKIRPFLNALRDYAKVIEVFVNAKPDLMAFIWGPIKVCLQIASKYDQAFDSLLSAYSKIRDALPNFASIEQLFGTQDAVSMVLRHVYTDILSFNKRAVTFFSKPGWRIALRLTCRALDDCYGDVLQNLAYSKELLYTRASIAHYHDSLEARQRTEQAFKDQQDRDRRARRLAVQTWLSAFSHKNQQHELEKLRRQYNGTCTWLFKERLWTKWTADASNTSSCFWISGIPGAGKTVLFSAMVNELQSLSAQNEDSSAVAYVYCRYNEDSRDNFVALVRSLISSLLEASDTAYDYLYDIATNSHERFATTKDILSSCIFDLLEFYDHVSIGIDGLDEIEPSERLLMTQLIHKLLNTNERETSPRIFLTSRAEHDLENTFASMTRFRLESEHVTPDIQHYVEIRCHELQNFQICASDLEELSRNIVQRCEGMFLLAKLTFDMFQWCTSKEDFHEELEGQQLPDGLDDAYNRILARIRRQDVAARRPRAARLLEVLALARRTLYLHEVQAALSISTEKGDIDIESRRYTQHFKQICGSLVEVNPDDSVMLVHTTAKRFLAEKSHDLFEMMSANLRFADYCLTYLLMGFIQPLYSDLELAQAAERGCLGFYHYASRYWASHLLSVVASGQDELDDQALHLCSKAVTLIGSVSDSNLSPDYSTSSLEMETSCITSWQARLTSLDQAFSQPENSDVKKATSPLLDYTLAQAARLQGSIEKTIQCAADVTRKQSLESMYGKRPFKCSNLACNRFHRGFASASERDIHAKTHQRPHKCEFLECVFSQTGFSSRSTLSKHIEMFHIDHLCTKFAQIQARSPENRLNELIDQQDVEAIEVFCSEFPIDHRTAIKAIDRAVRRKFAETAFAMARVFAKRLPDPQDIYKSKLLLHLAVSHGEVELLDTMLPVRYPPSQSTRWRNEARALFSEAVIAIKRGHHLVLQSLLQFGRVSSHKIPSETLEIFSSGSNIDLNIVSMLLEHSRLLGYTDLDIWSRSKEILLLAAEEGHTDLLQKILTNIPPTVSLTYKERKSVILALEKAEVVSAGNLALEIGSSADKTSFVRNAVELQDPPIIRSFVNDEILIDGTGIKEIALAAAAYHGKTEVASYSIERGANIETGALGHGTPLVAAVSQQHLDMIRLLVTAGAGINARCATNSYGPAVMDPTTPLLCAISLRKVKSLELLISLEADVHTPIKGITPLDMAISFSCGGQSLTQDVEALKTILRAGADPNAVYTPVAFDDLQEIGSLHRLLGTWLSFDDHMDEAVQIAQILITHGAWSDAKGSHGRSVLFHFGRIFESPAIHMTEKYWKKTLKLWDLLTSNGADVDAQDDQGITARKYLTGIGPELLMRAGIDMWAPPVPLVENLVLNEDASSAPHANPASSPELAVHRPSEFQDMFDVWSSSDQYNESIYLDFSNDRDTTDLVYNPW